jgi:glycosyltransferase involved in cell wall biosynthesis
MILSVVVPVHNEEENIRPFYKNLTKILSKHVGASYEIIFVNDGSHDNTAEHIRKICAKNKRLKLLQLSRQFGKEVALASGIAHASGKAVLMIDGDGQHPVEKIPEFISAWKQGAKVVVGIRTYSKNEGMIKRYGSKLFYVLFNRFSGAKLVPGSSDFRLIDRVVQKEFVRLHEPDSITRGLIDWLGFERAFIEYQANPRLAGVAGYKFSRLVRLAANSFVSLSPVPLYLFGYLGVLITIGAFLLGIFVFIEQVLFGDPWDLKFTGTAMLSILVLFLVGIILMAQGIMALYISHIHSQSKRRPLFVIDYEASAGIKKV